jgi:undecaprenyl-diphosphatase
MTLLEAIVLGVVQGITEFLPISSTAHLKIVPALLGWSDPGAAYSAVIQLGTVGAVLVYFAKDLLHLARAFVVGLRTRQPFGTLDSRLAWFVGLGTLPIGILGLLLKKFIEAQLRSLWVMSTSLIVFALVLAVVERLAKHSRKLDEMTLRDAMVVGAWQAMALVPGSSRSGTTLTGALSLGFARAEAARFSFLLSIPATTLAGVFELKHLLKADDAPPMLMLVVGTAVSFVAGLVAIWGLLRLLRTRSTMGFVVYRVLLGAMLLGLLSSGRLAA